MPDVTGKKLDVAYDELASAGLDDKDEVTIEGGGTFGVVIEANWTVCAQSPAAGQALAGSPTLTVERSCPQEAGQPDDTATTAADPTPAPTESATPKTPAVITIKNNADFAALLKLGDNCSRKVKQFATKYSGRTVRFDGTIGAVQPHGDTDTRYDFLVEPGDFDPDSAIGPTFQFRDKNASDLMVTGKKVPDYIKAGQNYTFVAELDDYDPGTCLYQLWPVKTVVR